MFWNLTVIHKKKIQMIFFRNVYFQNLTFGLLVLDYQLRSVMFFNFKFTVASLTLKNVLCWCVYVYLSLPNH